ncbi:MAG: pseudouridine-5'-phosphate glycosidase, partial [Firmicutes bacterium]|nr:pseudouridine-5'-phosphate glycosidase [Bacillota bacterium]
MGLLELKNYAEMSCEVQKAVSEGLPVCALETTILSHGLPKPFNLEVAHRVEPG